MLVVLGGVETTTDADFHLEVELGGTVEGADVEILVHDLLLGDLLDVAGRHVTGFVDGEGEGRGGAIVKVFKADLLEVEDDLCDILDDSGEGCELVLGSGDADGGDRRALERREENAAEAVANGVPESRFKRLRREFGVGIGGGGFVFGKTIGDFKRS